MIIWAYRSIRPGVNILKIDCRNLVSWKVFSYNCSTNIRIIECFKDASISNPRKAHTACASIVKDKLKNDNPFRHNENQSDVNRLLINQSNPDYITSADVSWIKDSDSDVLSPATEDVSDICGFTSPSFNLAAYVNKSHTLQELIKMGVDLHRIEMRKDAAISVLKLNFEKHIKQHLM